jgi:hypothetical protein
VIELPPNPSRSAFLFFSGRQQLLQANHGDQTLPLLAVELFRTAPERAFDELFAKFKLDPMFPRSAVYLVYAAHHTDAYGHGLAWANQALDFLKSQLHEPEEKPAKKPNARSSAKAPPPKRRGAASRGGRNPQRLSLESEAEIAATAKVQTVWNRYQARRRNLARFGAVNRYRAALNLLQAMCAMENEMPSPVAVPESIRAGRRHSIKLRSARLKETRRIAGDEEARASDNPIIVMTLMRRAIVLGDRSHDEVIIHAASSVMKVFLTSIGPGSPHFAAFSLLINQFIVVLVRFLPLSQLWARELLLDLFIFEAHADQFQNLTENLAFACQAEQECGKFLWLLGSAANIPKQLLDVQRRLEHRDPTENMFYAADTILQRSSPRTYDCFKSDPVISDVPRFVKCLSDAAVHLQQKQRFSMSVSILTRVACVMLHRNEVEIAVTKLSEALECHFRIVQCHKKVDQLLRNETEQSFYGKHSWAGCLSIFVISSLLSMHSKRGEALLLSKLAGFALAALFASTNSHPGKQLDYTDYEPPEIVPGIDIFSSLDPAQPLLQPSCPEYLMMSFSYLISAMLSFELYFEMFKPLAVARHFFRFIVRDRLSLARSRLIAVLGCCQFGFVQPAITIMGDIVTNFGHTRATNEFPLYSLLAQPPSFESSEPVHNPANMDCLKALSTAPTITAVVTNYGLVIGCQYVIAICRILQAVASCSDPTKAQTEIPPARTGIPSTTRAKSRRQHHAKKEADAANANVSSDVYDVITKLADGCLSEIMTKEFRPEHDITKLELRLEQSFVRMNQWRWEDAISEATAVLKATIPGKPTDMDQLLLTATGLKAAASSVIARASYNLNDFKTAAKFASPYYRALLLIRKADFEAAGQLLAQIASHPPITEFHLEYVMSAAQLCCLFCCRHKLVDSCMSKVSDRDKLMPITLIEMLNTTTTRFYIEELGLNNGRSYFIRNIDLLVRLRHLEAVVHGEFRGDKDPLELISDAQALMGGKCPFVPHGLSFLLTSSSSKLQMQSFLRRSPNLIQYWNREVNPLQGTTKFLPDVVEKMSASLFTMFSQAPDCIVHPASQQCVLDLAVLSGVVGTESGKRLEQSFAILAVAAAVRSSRRFVQSLIAASSDVPAMGCPALLLNENKDQGLRGIAAAYYSHVCSLDFPFFDMSLLELRTLFYFRCFEGPCSSFKTIQRTADQITFEPGHITGQWYRIEGAMLKTSMSVPADGTVKSSRATTATVTTASTANRGNVLKGSLYFFMGIIVDSDESKRKVITAKQPATSAPDPVKLVPIMFTAQLPDLQAMVDEMASVGLEIEEANRMENAETGVDMSQQKDQLESVRLRGRRAMRQTRPLEPMPTVSLLRGQAESALKNAALHWNLAVRKAEGIFSRSSQISGLLANQRNRCQAEIKMSGMDTSNATALSHLFNPQFGINEKAPQVTEWLSKNSGKFNAS